MGPAVWLFQKILVDLSTGGGEYDVFMTGPYAHWAYDKAGWTQPLEDYLQDPKMTASDYDAADLFPPLMAANGCSTMTAAPAQAAQWS